jgi:hypothetical protein
MPLVGFEPMTPVFEQAKTIHALESATTAIGSFGYAWPVFPLVFNRGL